MTNDKCKVRQSASERPMLDTIPVHSQSGGLSAVRAVKRRRLYGWEEILHAQIHARTCVPTYINTYIHTYIQLLTYLHTYTYTHARVRMCISVSSFMSVCMYSYMYR